MSQATTEIRDQSAKLAWWADELIKLPGGYRIGVDGLLGLVPGVGDTVGAILSTYILAIGYRQGVPWPTLINMLVNVVIDTTVGAIPVVGDVFDLFWKSNSRNVELMNRYLSDVPESARKARSRASWWPVAVGLVVFTLALAAVVFWLALELLSMVAGTFA